MDKTGVISEKCQIRRNSHICDHRIFCCDHKLTDAVNLANFIQFLKIRSNDSKVPMTQNRPTWAVVATVDEPPALVQAFVAWHLALGAAHVFVYCDRPDDPVQSLLTAVPQVTVVACDQAHWLRVGKSRPRRHEVRQVRNANDAYSQTDADWILHSDADEFVWVKDRVDAVLSTASDAVDCVVIPVAERNHQPNESGLSIFEGAFRRPFREPAHRGRKIFGPDFDLTYRGLTGHAQGKAFVRAGRAMRMSIHRPRPPAPDQELRLDRALADDLELLHFEGLTPRYWVYKLTRMTQALHERDGMPLSDHRKKQADLLPDAPDLYRRLKLPDVAVVDLLKGLGLWHTPSFDPSPAIARYFPDVTCDLRPAAIDDWLECNKPSVMAYRRKP
jgi:hypothetical protein